MINWRRPILEFYDSHFARSQVASYVAQMKEFDDYPAGQRRQIHSQRVSQLLLHAARNVPYYRETLARVGVVQGDQVHLTRFQHIPELTRDELHSEFGRLKSDDLMSRSYFMYGSGGSTGAPVNVLQDCYYDEMGLAVAQLHYAWAGKEPGEPIVKLWGSDRDVLLGTLGWRVKLSNFIRNQTFLNSWNMNRVQMLRYVESIQQVRPVMIEAYAESIYQIARYINEAKIKVPGVRSVITSAGTLYPFIREEVERAFGCSILDRYGSREVGGIAGERHAGAGLEVFTYTHLVEVVDDEGKPCGPGEEGEVLVTCLTNYAMPLIRYRLGDRAVVGSAVSSPIPSVERLRTITGRAMDAFMREDGSTIPGSFFIHFVGVVHYTYGWLKKTQIIQENYDQILIKIVAETPPPLGALEEIAGTLQRVMGPACQVRFEFVEAIPSLPSGKYQYTVSKVQARPREIIGILGQAS